MEMMQAQPTMPIEWKNSDAPIEKRDLATAIKRGLLCRCPNCGEGKLFGKYLKPVDHCAVCGEDYTHQRADDLPAYLSIVLVGHIVVGGFMMTDMVWTMSNWAHLAIWTPMTVLLALATIQPIKGRRHRTAMGDPYAWIRRQRATARRPFELRKTAMPR